MAYWRHASAWAWGRTAFYRPTNAALSVAIAIIQQWFYDGGKWSRAANFIGLTIAVYVVLTALEFVFRLLILAPMVLFNGQQLAPKQQRKPKAKRAPAAGTLEQNRRDVIKKALETASNREAMTAVLEFLLKHGETPRSVLIAGSGLPSAFAPTELGDALIDGVCKGIVAERIAPEFSLRDERLSVRPEMRAALEFCLFGK